MFSHLEMSSHFEMCSHVETPIIAAARKHKHGVAYRDRGMAAYSELQEAEFAAESEGYTATRHQREVGTGYFDDVAQVIAGGESSTTALRGSTEQEQFH